MQAGAAEYLLKPVNLDELQLVIRKVLDAHSMKQEFLYLKEQVQSASPSWSGKALP